jgi:hypothetical protein
VAAARGRGIFVLSPDTGRFEPVKGTGQNLREAYTSVHVLPRRRQTIAVRSDGVPFVVGDRFLAPWLPGVTDVYSLHDAPSLHATVVLDQARRLHVLTDDGAWHRIGSIARKDYGRLIDAPGSKAALFLANKSVLAIRKNGTGALARFRAEELPAETDSYVAAVYPASDIFDQVLTYGRGGWFDRRLRWRRLGPDGFEDIPGGDIGLPPDNPFPHGRIQDLPTIGRTLIEGRDGFFLYDGTALVPVRDGGRDRIGKLPQAYDLPTIGRVLVTTESGVFEITGDGRLVARAMPFAATGLPKPVFADWPAAGVALASSKDGIFAMDKGLKVAPVQGGDRVGFGWLDFSNGINLTTGDMILTGRRGLFLAVTDDLGHRGPCAEARSIERRIPESDICVRPIPGTDAASLGPSVGHVMEAPKGNGLLVDSVRGLFHIAPDGAVRPLQPRSGSFLRSLAPLPWADEVFAVGSIDSVVHQDLSIEEVGKGGSSDLLKVLPSIRSALVDTGNSGAMIALLHRDGDRYRLIETDTSENDIDVIVDAPWFGGPIVGNWHGLFSMDREGHLAEFDVDGLPRDYSGRYSFSGLTRWYGVRDFFSVPRFRTIFAWKRGWFRISPDRKWLPLSGLPEHARVVATFDPGAGEVLFGTKMGVFAVDEAGRARPLAGGFAPRRTIRAFAREARGGATLAGGDEGLFRIARDELSALPLENGTAETIGSVTRIVALGDSEVAIVEASNGTYALENGRISLIRDLVTAGAYSRVSTFPRVPRILVKKEGDAGPVLHELARRDGHGACSVALEGD